MSFVRTQPQAIATVAANLREVDAAVNAESEASHGATTLLVPAAADEVSAMTASRFAAHAHMYQALSTQAAAIRSIFIEVLAASANSYEATEAVNMIAAG